MNGDALIRRIIMKIFFANCCFFALALQNPIMATEKPAITHEKLWLVKPVGAPAPSPDGRWVAVPVTGSAYDEKDEVADLRDHAG